VHETEEFAHTGYFNASADPEREYILLAPAGCSVQRGGEIAAELRFLGGRVTALTTEGAGDVGANETVVLPAAAEHLSVFLTAVAVCLFAYRLGVLHGGEGIRFQSKEAMQEHFDTVHHSRFCDEAAAFDEARD